jgi:hypothetical protein
VFGGAELDDGGESFYWKQDDAERLKTKWEAIPSYAPNLYGVVQTLNDADAMPASDQGL